MHVRKVATVVAALTLGSLALGVREARANNWPPAKGADMTDPNNWPNDPGYQSAWNYWSWLPKQSAGTKPYLGADQTLGASGMHIDVGWTYTVGRPDVKIAIIDCGIKWDETDLADKAYLNAAELAKHKPQNADGSACGGAGMLAGYDCNGDGVFSVSDYVSDPRVAPVVTDPTDVCYPGADPNNKGQPRMMGDKNKNCILDAGDLIALFSDGVDDDANGYTDDISGWDFYKNDNDPYDDTRYGHGTGEGRMSSDQANNGQGEVGTCPDCRFFMLRVGDSFIVDVNDWAKGVVYAADNGAKVVQEAMGTIDQTTFSKAAIDYAYAHGTLIIASMADENSRHHNMPGTYNHVLTVHSMKLDGDMSGSNASISTTSTTFLNYDTCSNFGGQNALSISASSCSSEATGRSAGIAGLLFSEGLNQQLQLLPEEVMQLMKMTADTVDVPQSQSSDPNVADQFFESLSYFSQRFGYGRPNVDKAMQSIDAGLIPPEVDLTSPGWFDILYADRTTSPVPIEGRVAAKRAQSYDYRVEWAPGVEPADTDFVPIVDWVRNVSATTTTGGSSSSPLGMLAPSEINTAHTPDPDSAKFHENDRTITLRVLATAHYANGDVSGQARRSIAIVNQQNGLDADLAQGFPIAMGASTETSPKLADIDGDGIRDVVAAGSDGSVHVFTLKSGVPVELTGFPFHTNQLDGLNPNLTSEPTVPSYLSAPAYASGANGGIDPAMARETIVASPAVGDVNGDGKPEIVVSTYQGTVYVVAADGTLLPGWPKRLPLVPSCPFDLPSPTATMMPCMDTGHLWSRGAMASPVLADFNRDGKLEVVQAAFDGNIYVWQSDGTSLPGWPVPLHGVHANSYNRIVSTPAVADFNGDGVPDVVSGSNEEVGAGGGAGLAFIVDGHGMNASGGPYLPHWPVALGSIGIFPLIAEGINSAPAIADFAQSGKPQTLITGDGISPYVLPADPGEQIGFAPPPNQGPCYDEDAGTQTACGNGAQVGIDPTSIFGDGSQATRPDSMFPLFSSPSVGDLDQDGVPDIITSGGSLSVLGNTTGGASPAHPPQYLLGMWSGATGHVFYGSPVPIEDYTFLVNHAVADVTGDNYPEVMFGTGGYFVHAVDACGCEAPAWPKFTDGWIIATPAVGDIDGDHTLEVVTGTRDGNLFAWHTKGTDTGVIQWESFHHDNANSGNYGVALQQGVLERATQPIDCATDCIAAPAPTTTTYKAGGCGCRAIPDDDERAGAFALLAAASLGAVLARRKRQR
jgi:MYXO-CTERM domain-containing protein